MTVLFPPLSFRHTRMARLSFIALLALAFSNVALAAPPISQEIVAVGDVHTTDKWSYSNCGACLYTASVVSLNGITT